MGYFRLFHRPTGSWQIPGDAFLLPLVCLVLPAPLPLRNLTQRLIFGCSRWAGLCRDWRVAVVAAVELESHSARCHFSERLHYLRNFFAFTGNVFRLLQPHPDQPTLVVALPLWVASPSFLPTLGLFPLYCNEKQHIRPSWQSPGDTHCCSRPG